jgi:hypothetical protein
MKKILFIALIVSLTSAAYAQGRKAVAAPYATKSSKRYYAAGCGLGSLLFKENSLVHQVLGGTTNGTLGNQTFGMSSGTLDCEVDQGSSSSAAIYVEANKVALANDIARGNGETLVALNSIYGCANADKVATSLQSNYGRIFPTLNLNGDQINHNILSVLHETSSCL